MRCYRMLRWAWRLTGKEVFLHGAWKMLGRYALKAQHAVEDAEENFENVTEEVAEEAANLVKEYRNVLPRNHSGSIDREQSAHDLAAV